MDPPADNPAPAAAPAPAERAPLEALELRVRFDLGETPTTYGALAALEPGYVFDLRVPPEGAVQISAGETPLGTGELVRVGDSLGVRVVRVFDQGGPHA